MNNAQPAQTLVKWLSQYFIQHFVQRGDFFAQVLRPYWQTLTLHGQDGHIQSGQDGHNIQSRHSRSGQNGCSQNGYTLQKSDHNSVGSLNASPDAKVADLIASAGKQLGVGGAIDPSTLANVTLGDVMAALDTTYAIPHSIAPVKLLKRFVNGSTDSLPSYQSEAAIDPYGIFSGEHRQPIADAGSQAQPVYEKRFQVTFQASCGISRKVNVAQYISWVGNIRELLLRGLTADLPDLLRGEWDLVTNTVSLRVLGEATTDDNIQARCWIGNWLNATFDTYIEFCKVLPDETLEPLALAVVRATWVQPASDDLPPTQAFPTYVQAYLERFSIQVPAAIDLKQPPTSTLPPRSTSLASLNAGATLYRPQTHRYGDLLLLDVFQTTLEDSNRMGNIDDGSYFTWQGRMLDLFLYAIAPEYLRVPTAQGEMISLYSRIDFRQEALPFDRIQVALYVQSVSECGAVFQFEFFRERSVRCKEKLHTGQQEVIWADRQPDGTTVATPWPQSIRQALMQRQTTESRYTANVS